MTSLITFNGYFNLFTEIFEFLPAFICIFIFSVGGGSEENNISTNLVNAIKFGKEKGASVVGIVGKDGGYTKSVGDAVAVIPNVSSDRITPLTEGFQAVIWHLLVSHPDLQVNKAKWESVK